MKASLPVVRTIAHRSCIPAVLLILPSTLLAQQATPPTAENIIVTGARDAADYSEEETETFGYAPVKLTEVPQSVQILNRTFIDDSGALSIGELMQNVPGASNALSRTVPFGTGSLLVRGQDVAIFRDGLRDIDFSDIDQSALNNVERIDVLKGPAGLVYGTGGPGGVVNIITKRPLDRFAAETRLTVGDRDTFIISGDVSVPFGAGFGVRVTAEIERSDSFINFSEVERDNFSGVIAFDRGGPFTAAVTYENFANRDDNAMTRVGLPTRGTIIDRDIVVIDRNTYLGEPSFDFTDSYGTMASAYFRYELNDAVALTAAARRTTVHFDQAEVRTLGTLDPVTLTVPRSRARQLFLDEDQYNARAFLSANLQTGPVSHDVTIGYEYFDFFLFVDNRNVPGSQVGPISVVNPVYRKEPFTPGAPSVFTETNRSHEIFVQDVARIGPVTVTGALRQVWTDFEDSFGLDSSLDQTLYQLGATWEFFPGASIFGGYNTGFNANSGIAAASNRTGDPFDPETYRQFEAGIKTDALAGVTATLALFDLTRRGILVTDPVDAAFLIQVGEERSRGIEADVVWAPVRELSVRAGYLYLDSEVTRDTDPTRLGNQRPGAARHRANVFGSYTFLTGPLTNLRLSAGATYVGEAFASLGNTIVRPDYALVDLGASYTLGRVRLDAFLSNTFDEEYFIARNDATVNVGEPRLFRVRATVSF